MIVKGTKQLGSFKRGINLSFPKRNIISTPPITPTVPLAPTISEITNGDQQLSVSFTAGSDGGSSITNYEYSIDNGSTWTTRSPSSTLSPIIITGLTNGITYQVKIRAVNEIGSGAASSGVSATPAAPSIPTPSTTEFTVSNFSPNASPFVGINGEYVRLGYTFESDGYYAWGLNGDVIGAANFIFSVSDAGGGNYFWDLLDQGVNLIASNPSTDGSVFPQTGWVDLNNNPISFDVVAS